MATLDGVPALTLRNPWAHYVAHGQKRIENRVWPPPRSLTRVFIHAGSGWSRVPAHMVPAGDLGDPHTGAVVALAEVLGVCDASVDATTVRCGCGVWAMPGQFHWQLGRVVALRFPVACSGRLKLWKPDPHVVTAVAEQLALAA